MAGMTGGIVFHGDGSEYSKNVARGLLSLGVDVAEFKQSEALVDVVDDRTLAIVLVNPYMHLARAVRGVIDKAGGLISRTPIIAALGHRDMLSETDTLKYTDDIVVEPGGAEELVSRVKVLALKRGGEGNVIHIGELVVNLDYRQVFLGGKPVDLTYKEYELLKMMAATPGRAYSRDEILRSVWNYDYLGGTRTVDVHVRRVRAKIEGARKYIETVHGVGYRFVS
ncbi:MAG: response regulator transcription factor [Actinomycetia bacterium]|nr:response regulator transcription factor [Actinomycetes bacterium]